MLLKITNHFAILTIFGVVAAWFKPDLFTWMTDGSIQVWGQPLLSVALGLIMLAMGLTLKFDDYRNLITLQKALATGILLQFIVMPLSGFLIAMSLNLDEGLAVGLILVACCPGGTASNIVAYLARGNVALSVAMTMSSTIAAVILTPILTGELAGTYVEIDRWNLLRNMVGIVLIPVIVGTLLNQLFPRASNAIRSLLPVIAILLVILIVGGIVGGAKAQIIMYAGELLVATFLLHSVGFALGLFFAKKLGLSIAEQRTISIEVGMQNSGLGSGLAKTPAFAAQFTSIQQAALAPVPAAISAVWHVLIGSILASYWRRKVKSDEELCN